MAAVSTGYWVARDIGPRFYLLWIALHEAAVVFRHTFEACCRLGSQFTDANRMVSDPALVDDRCMPRSFKHRTTWQFCWCPSSDPLPNPNPAKPHAHQCLTQQQIQRISIAMDKRSTATIEGKGIPHDKGRLTGVIDLSLGANRPLHSPRMLEELMRNPRPIHTPQPV